MISLLAQTTAPLSAEFFGMVALALIIMSRWLFDYNRSRREESDRLEPKSTPPLHERFISRPEYTRDQQEVDERLTSATSSRKSMHKEIEKHTAEISVLQESKRTTETTLHNIDAKLTTILGRLPRT
ncbi:MAG: hypothetical protein WC205_16875 [Opitutaceae bacterium]|jgi:chromosome segregation ATPase